MQQSQNRQARRVFGLMLLLSVGLQAQLFPPGGGSGSPAFSAVTPGTNTGALLVGTGGSLAPTGTGTITPSVSAGVALCGATACVDSSYLNTLYAQLAAANIMLGKMTFNGLTATTPGRRLVCGSLPSGALVAGDEMCSAGGIWSYSDGAALQTPVRFTGSANAHGTAPTSGNLARWGTNFTQTDAGTAPIGTADIAANAVTSAKEAVVNTRRTCSMVVGADNGSALADADLGPQKKQCKIPYAATIVEMDVSADAGTPSIIAAVRHCSAFTSNVCSAETVSNIVSGALAVTTGGFDNCSKTSAVAGLDTGTTCAATLQNTAMVAGDYLELASGTAGGTAKRLSVSVVYTVN